MRFLLQSSRSAVANQAKALAPAATSAASPSTTAADDSVRGRAWGQQCSPDCGCVIRIETQLAQQHSSAASPTIVGASYHAKRVMATARTSDDDVRLKPLTTQHSAQASRPILTSCTCPTLHHLAQRTVDHLAGKTLAQVRNGMDMGSNGARSSVAFRHTVLQERVLPAIDAEGRSRKLGIAKIGERAHPSGEHANGEGASAASGADEMNSTQRHGHCYDLVEDALMSMIHERMPAPRIDSIAAAYSPTLGGHFRMYSPFQRNRPIDLGEEEEEMQLDERVVGQVSPFHDAGDWQRKSSPSSFFLFGDESNASGSMTGMFFWHARESLSSQIFGGNAIAKGEAAVGDAKEEHDRAAPNYLQLLDMYGDENGKEKEEDDDPYDDWLEYIDHVHSIGSVNRTG